MSTTDQSFLEELPFDTCVTLLRTESVGRIAVVPDVDQPPVIVPVNYRLVETSGLQWLALRTRPGNVIDRASTNVAFEIDGVDHVGRQGWSVLVRGMLHRLDPDAAAFRERFDPEPWIVAGRDHWLAVEPFTITGRRLHGVDTVEWVFSLRAYL